MPLVAKARGVGFLAVATRGRARQAKRRVIWQSKVAPIIRIAETLG